MFKYDTCLGLSALRCKSKTCHLKDGLLQGVECLPVIPDVGDCRRLSFEISLDLRSETISKTKIK